MYFTYILKSEKFNKTYTGHTENLERRLSQHNNGNSTFSRIYRPWKVIYFEEHEKVYDAIKKEKYFKSAAGRRWMKKNLFSN